MKKIFIGGTGRSGTTICSRWIGSHKKISRIPAETRFIVDSGGMIDLFDDLTARYSHDRARVAARQFFELMERDLTESWGAPYVGFNFDDLFSGNYRSAIDNLRKTIVIGEYIGSDYHSLPRLPRRIDALIRRSQILRMARLANRALGRKVNSDWPEEHILVSRRFEQEELSEILGGFIDTLFGGFAETSGVKGWCEDTPANTLHIPFLLALLPDSKHIHMVRNPYGVAYSYSRQIWAPDDFRLVVALLVQLYKQIITVIEELPESLRKSVKTVRLETLADEKKQENICEWLGVPLGEFDGSIQLKQISINSDKENLIRDEIDLVDRHLGFVMDYFGYWER